MGVSLRRHLDRLRSWLGSLDFALARWFGLATREDRLFYLVIGLVGVMGGLLGLATASLIEGVHLLLYGQSGELMTILPALPQWRVIVAPAAGGVLVGLILWLSSRFSKGAPTSEGIASLIEAVALSGGKIRARPALWNALTAVATVGAGGSLGREGPMIRLGAMISSRLGQWADIPPHRLKILVGCGAAAGLSATYNIPIGGTLFAMEVILGNFALEIFGPIVASSVIATLISRSLLGNQPLYAAPGYSLESGWEMLFYVGLGLVGALASVAFGVGVSWGGRLFRRIRFLPRPLHPVVGMALLGVIGLYLPLVLGRAYGAINLALEGNLDLAAQWKVPAKYTVLLLLGLALAKVAATALTRGCGGAGGLFTPSLFVGAVVGAAYGHGVHTLWPEITSPAGAYAAVGMAAVMAGTSHAPISAILILFELSGNYDLILPVMVASILSSVVARRLRPASLYTEPLMRRGIELPWRMEEAVLAGLKAEDLCRPDPNVLSPAEPYREVVDRFLRTKRQRLFVVSTDGRLLGAVSLHDIKHALDNPDTLTAVVAHDLMLPVEHTIRQDERLHRVTELFATSDFERLPVIDEAGKLVGVLAKRDLLAVYAQEVLGRPALLATFVSSQAAEASRRYVEIPPDFSLRLLEVPPHLIGRTLVEAQLPQTVGARIMAIRRSGRHGEENVQPTGDTVLLAGDSLLLLGPTVGLDALAAGPPEPTDEALAHRGID